MFAKPTLPETSSEAPRCHQEARGSFRQHNEGLHRSTSSTGSASAPTESSVAILLQAGDWPPRCGSWGRDFNPAIQDRRPPPHPCPQPRTCSPRKGGTIIVSLAERYYTCSVNDRQTGADSWSWPHRSLSEDVSTFQSQGHYFCHRHLQAQPVPPSAPGPTQSPSFHPPPRLARPRVLYHETKPPTPAVWHS